MTSDRILFSDDCFTCVNKRPTELVEWNDSQERPLAEDVREHLSQSGNDFVGIVHRLDRPTSGAVLFARNERCLKQLNEMLREQRIDKTYWAVVDAAPPQTQGRIEHYILHNRGMNKSYALSQPRDDARYASLSYRHIGQSDRYHLLEIRLHTGRHHQIRAQLHRIGCHIKGDLKYGFSRSNKGGGIHLHARRIRFAHPLTGDTIDITAPVPPDTLWEYFAASLDR
ncbi:MAG: RluA family pseudouridine synthase [Spirochaetota bacterium]